jgi:hypothetical protein
VRKLNEAVARFLAPWQFDAEIPLRIGGGIGQAHRLWMQIENQPYVEELTDLALLHVYRDKTGYHSRYWPPEESSPALGLDAPIVVSAPWSVLVPASQQDWFLLDSKRPNRRLDPRVGLGLLELGTDWVVE